MRLKQKEICISAVITVVVFVLSAILSMTGNKQDHDTGSALLSFVNTALLGVFGSALVVLLLSAFEYATAKKNALRSFRFAVFSMIDSLMVTEYYMERESDDIVIEAIRERENRPIMKTMAERAAKEHPDSKSGSDDLSGTETTVSQKALAEEIRRVLLTELPEGCCLQSSDQWYMDEADLRIDAYIAQIERLVKQYQRLAKTDIVPLLNSFYEVCFISDLFRKDKMKDKLERDIVTPLIMVPKVIQNASRLFALPSAEQDYSHANALKEIIDLQKILFILEERQFNGVSYPVIVQKTLDAVQSKMKGEYEELFAHPREDI